MYTALVLDKQHQSYILALKETIAHAACFHKASVKDWKDYAHHMTLNMGGFDKGENPKEVLGEHFTVKCDAVGCNGKCLALRVSDTSGLISVNDVPHITVAVDVENGAKPFMSNEITEWIPVNTPFYVSGIVQEL